MAGEQDEFRDSAATMTQLVVGLAKRLGRYPTEDEVYDFIMGDDEQRTKILESGVDGDV